MLLLFLCSFLKYKAQEQEISFLAFSLFIYLLNITLIFVLDRNFRLSR
jgi:hypothetical protein